MPLQESMHPTTENTTFPQPCLQKLQKGNNPTSESDVFRYRNQFIPLQESMHPTTEIITFPQPSLQKGSTPNSEYVVCRYRNQSIPLQK
mmetsp:Transcript_53727/g.78747  ORF Transcript_53727/g.78747 Transcript_53727/m.78747 type:complete len:89 (+) Transcript_53727:143-409(+)